MSFSVGIVGLPNAGKSTLFKALTKKEVDIAAYPFTTIHPNVGMVEVKDDKLEKIAKVVKPEKITPTVIEFADIAGLVKKAHQGEGLGNQFLSHIRNCDAILAVFRNFIDPNVEQITGEINPLNDYEIINTELLMKDLETLEHSLSKLEKELKTNKDAAKKLEILKKIKEAVSSGSLISDLNLDAKEKELIKEYRFLTAKPKINLINVNEKSSRSYPSKLDLHNFKKDLIIDLKLEKELSELSQNEREELNMKTCLDKLILACYNILDLITFFTVKGGKEVKAWTLKKGSTSFEAANKVHTDFAQRFIKAEVIDWQELITTGSWLKARELGKIKTVGKDYLIQDGEIVEFKI